MAIGADDEVQELALTIFSVNAHSEYVRPVLVPCWKNSVQSPAEPEHKE